MDETVSLFGIELKDIPVSGSREVLDEYLNNHVLNTMEVITKDMLVYAGEHPEYKKILEELDLHIVVDRDIYVAAGRNNDEYVNKAGEQIIWKTLLDLILRENKNCFLIGPSVRELDLLEKYLKDTCPGIRLNGRGYIEEGADENAFENLINECNGFGPDVIFAALPVPFQEMLLDFSVKKLGARMWIGLGIHGENGLGEEAGFLSRWIGNAVFRRMAQQYRQNLDENA